MKIAATIVAIAAVLAGSTVVYADQAGLSVKDIGTTEAAALPDYFVSKPVTSIGPGIVVYKNDGKRLGAVRAVIRQTDTAKKIYVGRTEYSAASITIENGRAIYTPEVL